MSYTQIAKVLGRDEKSTDNALQRLKSKIRKLVWTIEEPILEKNLSGIIKGINQNKGIINEKIASVIYCRSFIKKFEDEYNKIFNSLGFKISRITDDYIYISYIDSKIEFFIASSEFMRRYARVLFNNKNTIDDAILDKFQLVNTEENINKFIERCNNILEDSQYKLKSEVIDGEISNIMNIFNQNWV